MVMPQKIQMQVRHPAPQVAVIDIQGELTAFAENQLMDAYTLASSKGAQLIVLNCDEMEFMNSSGIGLLVTMLVRAKRQNQKMAAVGLNEHFQHIFELTRLNEAIPVYASEAEVLAQA